MDVMDVMLSVEFGLPLVASLITGICIGLDREVLGKPAGLRTHALVSLAATLLTLAAAHQDQWILDLVPGTQIVSDPTRMAHGILTGIGFLGAGVIFRQGPSVHGLTTAASLWITAALGVVYGVGMLDLALIGSAATLVVLVGLRVLHAVLPRRSVVHLSVIGQEGGGLDGATLRQVLERHGLPAPVLSESFDAGSGHTTWSATIVGSNLTSCDGLSSALRAHPGLVGFDVRVHEDGGESHH